MTKTFQRIRKY